DACQSRNPPHCRLVDVHHPTRAGCLNLLRCTHNGGNDRRQGSGESSGLRRGANHGRPQASRPARQGRAGRQGTGCAGAAHAAGHRSAEEAAAACGCAIGQIVKSLVFRGAASGRPYLLLVSGANRVNEAAVAVLLGEALQRPDARTVRELTGFAIGGIPPLGHRAPLATYLGEALLAFAEVWAAAGTPDAVFPVAPDRLRVATEAHVIRVT